MKYLWVFVLISCSTAFGAQKDVVILLPKVDSITPSTSSGSHNCKSLDNVMNNPECFSAKVSLKSDKKTNSTEKIAVKLKELKGFLRDARSEVCDAIKPASISMSIAVTEEGSMIFVSGSLEAGLSVTIECK